MVLGVGLLSLFIVFKEINGNVTLDIPILEVDKLNDGLEYALRRPGTAALVGHGIILRQVLAAARAVLYDCEHDDLQQCIPLGGESGSADLLESKSSFIMKGIHNEEYWPLATVDSHRSILIAAYKQLCELAHRIIQAMPSSWNQKNCCNIDANQTATLRLFRYEPHPAHPRYIGSAPHTDWGLLTLVLADDLLHASRQGGQLEISLQHEVWQPIAVPADDAIILNAGDYLALSAPPNEVHSPRHRVRLDQDKDRISLVFFFYPDSHAPLPPALLHGASSHDQDLSLLECQAASTECSTRDTAGMTFSDFIQMKWSQVAR